MAAFSIDRATALAILGEKDNGQDEALLMAMVMSITEVPIVPPAATAAGDEEEDEDTPRAEVVENERLRTENEGLRAQLAVERHLRHEVEAESLAKQAQLEEAFGDNEHLRADVQELVRQIRQLDEQFYRARTEFIRRERTLLVRAQGQESDMRATAAEVLLDVSKDVPTTDHERAALERIVESRHDDEILRGILRNLREHSGLPPSVLILAQTLGVDMDRVD